MKLGIKVGSGDWKEKLTLAKYEAVEVHFRPNKLQEYLPLFEYLKKHNILTGLHFWGTISNGYFPNFASDDPKILKESLDAIQNTINIAHQWNFDYVLTHPFSRDLWRIDENRMFEQTVLDMNWETSYNNMNNNFSTLNQYATEKNINFILETEVKREPACWGENNDGSAIDVNAVSLTDFELFGKQKIKLALDCAHITTWHNHSDRIIIFNSVKQTLSTLKKYAHVIHIGSIKPPFITDTGNGFTPEEDKLNVFPNSTEILELLEIFKDTDVIVIPEPKKEDHLWHNSFLNASGLFSSS